MNPKVRELAETYLGNHERIELIEPLDVVDFHNFAKHAYLIMTDSGGIKKRHHCINQSLCLERRLKRLIEDYDDLALVYPVHMNPKVRELAETYLGNHERIELIEPLDVVDFHNFAKHAYLIMTDSGGIQEEAPSLHKPVLVLRETTERPEG